VVVTDGMGGYEAGDLASGIAIRNIGACLMPLVNFALISQFPDVETTAPASNAAKPGGQEYSLLSGLQSLFGNKSGGEAPAGTRNAGNASFDTSPAGIARSIEEAIAEANRIVYSKAQADSKCKGMGATAAVVIIWEGQVLIGNVGDCRVYHSRMQRLTQLTKDQTLVARMIELGQLTPKEALSHPSRNEVAQAVGRRTIIEPGRCELQLARKDWLLVACDGLHTHVDDKMIQDAINQATSAAQLANQLVNLANQNGGSDNTTVVAIRCY
jgi:protein phosphatase